ncbi:hypothetical protein D3C77_205820 [compost metagenome]
MRSDPHFAHRRPEHAAHREHDKGEGQRRGHARIDVTRALGHHEDDHHQRQQCQECPFQVTAGALELFVGNETTGRAAKNLQHVLVDDAVGADQRNRQAIDFLEVGNEVGQAAVNDVDHEHVAADHPDRRDLDRFHQVGQRVFLRANDRCAVVALEQEPGQHACGDVDERIEHDGGFQARFGSAHDNEHTERRERHQGVDHPATAFEQAEQAPLFLVIAQPANGLEQRRPVDAVGTHCQQAKDDHQAAERREGRQIQAQRASAEQADRNQFTGVETVGKQAADHEQAGSDDGVGTEQQTDLGMGQAHERLHRYVERVLEVGQLVDGAATEDQDQEFEPFGLVVRSHCYSPGVVGSRCQALVARLSSARVRSSASRPLT